MKRIIAMAGLCLGLIGPPGLLRAAVDWPATIAVNNGKITIYQPQPESLNGNKLTFRTALSVTIGSNDPVFGAMWGEALLNTNRDTRTATLQSLKVTRLKFPDTDSSKVNQLKALIEEKVAGAQWNISLDNIAASLENENDHKSNRLNNTPPEIIYADSPTLLVVIDGEPKLQEDKELDMQRVVNTPFVLVQGKDKLYYLYVSERWFSTDNITNGSWTYVKTPPKDIKSADKKIRKADEKNSQNKGQASEVIPQIVVRSKPAEIIQSNGKADFKNIEGTALLYMSNTEDNIFMDIDNQQYYVLLSGRWYTSKALDKGWAYIEGTQLPADFGKIPEGSDKDIVLSSIPGTPAAKEAVIDAQVPQTAKVDRKTATTKVSYDGTPQFKPVEGTSMQYAVNTPSTVLKDHDKYYTVDNGVWFTADSPTGPWSVATQRPEDVEEIPADNPAYNVKYVYIYDVTPEYVWMGYTPGYMGCYIYGGTVVYGTGFYYAPWYGAYYYPRPVTWGFSMHYNPWYGWSMGIGINVGCFSFGFAFHPGGGWWGPPVYRPPYHYPYAHYYGPRPAGPIAPRNNIIINNNIYVNNHNRVYNNNVYSRRSGVTSNTHGISARRTGNDNKFSGAERHGRDNVQVGRDGNIYRQNNDGQLQQRRENAWQPAQQTDKFNQQQRNFERGENRSNNFQNFQRSNNSQQQRQMPQRSGGFSGGGRRR